MYSSSKYEIEIYNALGEKVYSAKDAAPSFVIDLSVKSNEIYFVEAISGATQSIQKIIISNK